MIVEPLQVVVLMLIGLSAGLIGGMIGIGGSIVMIPAMAILFAHAPWATQHLLQAAAMIVNFAVALPSALRHRANGAVRGDLLRVMLPAAILAIVAGVFVSNQFGGSFLRKAFAVFLVYVAVDESTKLIRRARDYSGQRAKVTVVRGGLVGGVMGFAAGLLGIGGGGIAVPLSRVVCRLPVRECIGTVAAVMCVTACFGAATKMATLGEHHADWRDALILALILTPTAVLGGYLGAGLTHRLPLRVVRIVFIVTLVAAAGRMGGLY